MNRAEVETSTIRRCKGYMDRTGLNTTVMDGSNGDCNEPMAAALVFVNIIPVDRSAVADADLTTLTGATLEAYVDLVELKFTSLILICRIKRIFRRRAA